jgi:hypothetical protein
VGVATILGIIGLVAVVFWIFLQIGRSHQTPETPAPPGAGAPVSAPMGSVVEPGPQAPQGDPRVYEIASRFFCRCGTCDGQDRVSDCGCTHPRGAREVLGFIASELSAGKTETDVIRAVTTRYGGFAG